MVARTRTGKAYNRALAAAEAETSCLSKPSPLLTLPPELRQIIWIASLGGYMIKSVAPHFPPMGFHCELMEHGIPREFNRLNEMLEPWTSVSNRLLVLGDGDLTTEPPEVEVKQNKRKKEGERLGLNLLATCKAIMKEAYLVPFASNSWIFYSVEDMNAFVTFVSEGKGDRGKRKLAAIRSIMIDDWHQAIWNGWARIGGLPRNTFTGLRSVTIMLDDPRRDGVEKGSPLVKQLWSTTKVLMGTYLLEDLNVDCDILVLSENHLWEKSSMAKRDDGAEFVLRDKWYTEGTKTMKSQLTESTRKTMKRSNKATE